MSRVNDKGRQNEFLDYKGGRNGEGENRLEGNDKE